MGEEETKKSEAATVTVPTLADALEPVEELNQKAADSALEISSQGSTDRDNILSKVELEKRNALIKAWEENEKAKVENKIYRKLSAVGSWEDTKRSYVDMKIKNYEEKVERKKAEHVEIMKNKLAEIHLAAEEKKAIVQTKRNEECLRIEKTAAKYKSVGHVPGKCLGCFCS